MSNPQTTPHTHKYWIMGTGIYHAPASRKSYDAVLIAKCETVEQAWAIKRELGDDN